MEVGRGGVKTGATGATGCYIFRIWLVGPGESSPGWLEMISSVEVSGQKWSNWSVVINIEPTYF